LKHLNFIRKNPVKFYPSQESQKPGKPGKPPARKAKKAKKSRTKAKKNPAKKNPAKKNWTIYGIVEFLGVHLMCFAPPLP